MGTTQASQNKQSQSLFESLGGEPAIRATVDQFYERVLADPDLAPYFEGKQIKSLKTKQVAFFSQALGGPKKYRGRNMARAHAHLGITHKHFDAVAGHLLDTLLALGVDQATANEVISVAGSLRDDIVTEKGDKAMDMAQRDVDRNNGVVDNLDGLIATMESLQANVFVANTDLHIVYINPCAEKTLNTIAGPLMDAFGVNVREILNGHIHRFHKDPKRVESILRNPSALPHSADFTFGGVTLRTRINAALDKQKRIIGYTVCWDDVTKELVQQNEFRRVMNMVEQMPTNVFLCDRDLNIIYVNPAAQRTMEKLQQHISVRADQLVGTNIDVFHKHPEHQRRILSDPANLPHKARIRIGEEVSDLLVNAIYDAEGNYVGPMLTWEIVTEKVRLEDRIRETTEVLASSSGQMISTSEQITENADVTTEKAQAATTTADRINDNVQAVSSGIEEMSSSIKEIAKNATDAARVADEAVGIAEETNTTISDLGDSSSEIGKVIKVITGIAQQTNLLALNATIEAARAGDAGRGFAVVANEVKELAKETSRATEDIGLKIEAIQGGVRGAVDGIARISEVIHHISQVQASIASAVEEQTITSNDMGRRVAETASGTNEVAGNIADVAAAADSTSKGIASMRDAATELSRLATDLQALLVDAEQTDRRAR